MTYEVTCTRCGLHREMDDLEAAFDLENEHQERHDESHVLEFELVH